MGGLFRVGAGRSVENRRFAPLSPVDFAVDGAALDRKPTSQPALRPTVAPE
jgi:hypothetical protein